MSNQFPGPYAGLSSPTRDDAIYATKNCVGPHGSGQLNYVNPANGNQAIQDANNAAITAAYNAGGNPVLSPTYNPPASLKTACDAWNVWWNEQHPPKDKGDKHKGDPSKKHQ